MFPSVNCNGDNADIADPNIFESDDDFELKQIEAKFLSFNKNQQIKIVEGLLKHMSHYQHGQIDSYLKPMLQRDFISDLPARGLFHVSEQILYYLDAKTLCAASQVSRNWNQVIHDGHLWKKLIERKVMSQSLWRGLGERRGWINKLRIPGGVTSGNFTKSNHNSASSGNNMSLSPASPCQNSSSDFYTGSDFVMSDNSFLTGYELMEPDFYRCLYPQIIQDINRINKNWLSGQCKVKKIECHSESSKGVYCLQYDDKKIVSGLRDNTIKVWDARSLECIRILTGHLGSVLCLQYDDKVIISGSSDATVRVWSLSSWLCVNTIFHHCEAVLHLRFAHSILVTCSKDRSIAVWDMITPADIRIRRVLVGHRAAVNVVDFDQRNIVSASGDRTIKVWNTQSCEFIHTMSGHRRGIACLQYRNNLVVSGSSDNSIRLWEIESGNCIRVLEGHEELVRCIRFDCNYIVSGAYDGKIKVWDLKAALNPSSSANSLCLQTLTEHTGRVFRLQFDEFQIVSSSHDDTILIWDFLNTTPSSSSPTSSSTVAPAPPNAPPTTPSNNTVNQQAASIIINQSGDTSPQLSSMIGSTATLTSSINLALHNNTTPSSASNALDMQLHHDLHNNTTDEFFDMNIDE